MDSVYRDVLSCQASLPDTERQRSSATDQSGRSQSLDSQSAASSDPGPDLQEDQRSGSKASEQQVTLDQSEPPAAPHIQIRLNQPIGSLRGAAVPGPGGPLTVRGEIQAVTDEEILKNRESEEGIRSIPRFRNYQPGKASKV